MQLTKFRVRNYKSNVDSGDCWLASDLTILAGKNESGKTAMLEALRDFDPRESIPDAANPIDDASVTPALEATFAVAPDELDELLSPDADALRAEIRKIIAAEGGLVVRKQADGQYRFGDALAEAIKRADAAEAERAAQVEAARAEAAARAAEERARLAAAAEDQEAAEDDEPADLAVEEEEEEEEEEEAVTPITPTAPTAPPQPAPLLERVVERIPRFVFFSSFDQPLPFDITFARARSNQAVQDFAAVAGLDLAAVSKIDDVQTRRNVLARHSATLSGDFKRFWHQDKITLSVSSEGQTLVLAVQEEGRTDAFKTEQRSKGFQWFLAFYLRLSAEGGERRVILIDEPGLYLHARAQQDVLEVLEELATGSQIVFSTHSPYLLDADRLDRIRLVVKGATGTAIQGKVHAGADMETLTPIITSVGLDATNSFSLAGNRNVVLEGITDYFYLQALRQYVEPELQQNLCFIPAVGAQNVPKLVSFLIGWGLAYAAVLDHDTAGKKAATTLRDELSVEDARIVFVSDVTDQSIEDVFTKAEFRRLVLQEPNTKEGDDANSKIVKTKTYDSALLAREFFGRVKADKDAVNLSKGTIDRATALFQRIVAGLDA